MVLGAATATYYVSHDYYTNRIDEVRHESNNRVEKIQTEAIDKITKSEQRAIKAEERADSLQWLLQNHSHPTEPDMPADIGPKYMPAPLLPHSYFRRIFPYDEY